MTGRVFGRSVNRNVHAVIQWLEKERRCPGVIHHDDGIVRVGSRCNRRNVLNFVGIGSRRFGEDYLGIGFHQFRDARSDQRVVVVDVDTESGEHRVRKAPCRKVDRIDKKQMVTGFQKGKQRNHDRRQSRRHDNRARRAFEFVNGRSQCIRCRSATCSISVFLGA